MLTINLADDEWQYHLSGQSRMTFSRQVELHKRSTTRRATSATSRGPCPTISRTGTTTMRFLEMFKSPKFEDVPLAQWLAFTPHELVRVHLKIDELVLAKIPPRKMPVVGA